MSEEKGVSPLLLILPVILAIIMLGVAIGAASFLSNGPIRMISNLFGANKSDTVPPFSTTACSAKSQSYACNAPTINVNISGVLNPSGVGYAGVPLFLQTDSRYKSNSYGTSQPFKAWGCAVSSVSMVLRFYNKPVDPNIIASKYVNKSNKNLSFSSVASAYNMSYRRDSGSWSSAMPDIISSLNNHQPVVVGAKGTPIYNMKLGDSPFSTHGHFVVFAAYLPATNSIVVNNPEKTAPVTYSVSSLEKTKFNHADFYTPNT